MSETRRNKFLQSMAASKAGLPVAAQKLAKTIEEVDQFLLAQRDVRLAPHMGLHLRWQARHTAPQPHSPQPQPPPLAGPCTQASRLAPRRSSTSRAASWPS